MKAVEGWSKYTALPQLEGDILGISNDARSSIVHADWLSCFQCSRSRQSRLLLHKMRLSAFSPAAGIKIGRKVPAPR